MNEKATHLFFDLDDTVTLSRSRIDEDMRALLNSLPQDIIIISGAKASQIRTQIQDVNAYCLGQNGNEALNPVGETLWNIPLSPRETEIIRDHIAALRKVAAFEVKDENDLVEERGAQISYSLIGHHEDVPKKKASDPAHQVRDALLKQVPFESDEVELKIGGTTCFDYFPKGKNKGYNIQKLIEHEGWKKEDCIYFGDSLFPGGNDETVIGVIETVPVKNHRDTYEKLSNFS